MPSACSHQLVELGLWGVKHSPGVPHFNMVVLATNELKGPFAEQSWSLWSCFRVGTTLLTHLELTVLFVFYLCLDNLPPSADSIGCFSLSGYNLDFVPYF